MKRKGFDHLSASGIESFLTCPRKFYLSYVEGVVSPPSMPMTFGKLFHSAAEGEKVELPEGDLFYNNLLMENAVKSYNKYRDSLPMQPDYTVREACFKLNTPYKPIIGYIDVVDQYGEELVFGDLKTTQRNAGAHYLDSIQYKLYTLALHGDNANPFNRKRRVEVVALRKSGKVDVEAYSDFVGDKYLELSRMMTVETLLFIAHCESSNFFPANMRSCNPQPGQGFKCGFNDLCSNNPGAGVRTLAKIALETEGFEKKEQKEHVPVFEEEL